MSKTELELIPVGKVNRKTKKVSYLGMGDARQIARSNGKLVAFDPDKAKKINADKAVADAKAAEDAKKADGGGDGGGGADPNAVRK